MYDLIKLINSYSEKIAICALFIIVIILFVKKIGIKSLDSLLTKIIKPAVYVLLASGLIHIVFSLRMAIK